VPLGHRPDGLALPRLASALLKPAHGLPGAVHRLADDLLGDGPLEHADDPSDPLVDDATAQVRGDHLLANGLQLQGGEVGGGEGAVELAERPQAQSVVVQFVGVGAVRPAVVLLGVPPEGENQFVDRDGVAALFGRQPPAVRQSLRDELVVGRFRGGGRILGMGRSRSQVVVVAAESHEGLAGWLVPPEGGDAGFCRHGTGPLTAIPAEYRVSVSEDRTILRRMGDA
jgi:hypothetical protein